MGIFKRAQIVAKKMKFSEQANLYLRIKRLLSPKSMGNLFKVILAYKFNNDNFVGFK
jgi:SAM-dependent MidA family methyltransferase